MIPHSRSTCVLMPADLAIDAAGIAVPLVLEPISMPEFVEICEEEDVGRG